MTAEQTAEILTSDVLVGFNLAMAREELKCAITEDSATMPQIHEVVNGYLVAFNDAFFGPDALKNIDRPEHAAEVVYGQLGCLIAQHTVSLESITETLSTKTRHHELPLATEHTIRDLINPFMVRS